MSTDDNVTAWIETPKGERVPIQGNSSIGRLSSSTIVLPDVKVSRRHAIINVQGNHEYWIVDFGSGNGTYLNGRRITQPTRLHDGDCIEIGSLALKFHLTKAGVFQTPTGETSAGDTAFEPGKPANCWLLVADIEGSTEWMKKSPDGNAPMFTNEWLSKCRELVESCGGSMNKFLGDGFFAYWQHSPEADKQVARAYELLVKMQDTAHPPFRIVLHFGQAYLGGGASMGEESLQGKEVHFVFRMEKLASQIGESCLVSDAARSRLPSGITLANAGLHRVPGFEDEYAFHTRAA